MKRFLIQYCDSFCLLSISSLSCSDLLIAIYRLQECSDVCEHETDNHSFRGHDLNWNHERDIRKKLKCVCFVPECKVFILLIIHDNVWKQLKSKVVRTDVDSLSQPFSRLLFAVDLKEFLSRFNARCGSTYAVNKIITFSHMVISGLSSVGKRQKKY